MGTLGFLFSPEKRVRATAATTAQHYIKAIQHHRGRRRLRRQGGTHRDNFEKKRKKKGKFRLSLSEQKIEEEVERGLYLLAFGA
jgi:hypothetical protein